MSTYGLNMLASLAEVNESEEILLSMIRGGDNMTENTENQLVNVVEEISSRTITRKKVVGRVYKHRGKNKVSFGQHGLEKMVFNKFGQPVGPSKTVARFSRFIGSLAREPSMFPINVPDFRKFKNTGRFESAWVDIKNKIDWSDPESLAVKDRFQLLVKAKLSARWRKHKHRLYANYYADVKGCPERFVCPDKDVNQAQWRDLVLWWDNIGEKKSVTTKKSRTQLKVAANSGTKTFAQIRYEWELANPGKELDRLTFWRMIHSKPKLDASGTKPINEEAAKIFLELDNLEQRERLNGREITAELLNGLFGEQFGPEINNAVRGYGLGVEWVDVPGIQTLKATRASDVASLRLELEASRAEIIKLTEEAAKKDDKVDSLESEVNSIKTRIDNPLHSILSGGPEGIKKLIAALAGMQETRSTSV